VLGLLARLAEPVAEPVAEPTSATVSAPAAAAVVSPAPVVVTAGSGETVWDVADRVAPGLSGPRRAALAERIVVDNGLASVRLRPGQVLRVAAG
jgi:Tfp pilus assembly protein FimV